MKNTINKDLPKIILEGIVGSTAYGLDTINSDIDYAGIFVYPTPFLLHLNSYKETFTQQDLTPDTIESDFVYHEIKKFMQLASKGNPSALELLYLDNYTKLTQEGQLLVTLRYEFLNNHIKNAYGGYAYQQAKKLEKRIEEGREGYNPKVKNRFSKHTRHCFRLLDQGTQLLTTGTLNVKVNDPDKYFKLGSLPYEKVIKIFKEEYAKYNELESVLPETSNIDILNKILLIIRNLN